MPIHRRWQLSPHNYPLELYTELPQTDLSSSTSSVQSYSNFITRIKDISSNLVLFQPPRQEPEPARCRTDKHRLYERTISSLISLTTWRTLSDNIWLIRKTFLYDVIIIIFTSQMMINIRCCLEIHLEMISVSLMAFTSLKPDVNNLMPFISPWCSLLFHSSGKNEKTMVLMICNNIIISMLNWVWTYTLRTPISLSLSLSLSLSVYLIIRHRFH